MLVRIINVIMNSIVFLSAIICKFEIKNVRILIFEFLFLKSFFLKNLFNSRFFFSIDKRRKKNITRDRFNV